MARKTRRPNKPRKPSRPTVIDLHAEEVDAAKPASARSAQGSGTDAAAQPTAAKPSDQAKPASQARDGAADKTKTETGQKAKPAGQAEDRPRSAGKTGGSSGGGKTALVAVSLVALIAAAAAGAWAYRSYGPAGMAGEQVAQLQQQLDSLQSNAKDRAVRISKLEGELQAARKEMLDNLNAQRQASEGSVSKLNSGIEDLKAAISNAASSAGADSSAAQAGTVLKVEELNETVNGLKQQVTGLQETLAASRSGSQEAAMDALNKRMDALSQSIDALRQEQETRARQTVSALGQGFAKLSAAVTSGKPFADELDGVVEVVPTLPGIAELRKYADSGVKSSETLANNLEQIANQFQQAVAQQAETKAQEGGFFAALGSKLTTVVKVRKVGETDWPATLDAAAGKVRDGDLKDTVSMLAGTAGTPPDGLDKWLESARNKLAADTALTTLSQAVLRHLAATGTSG